MMTHTGRYVARMQHIHSCSWLRIWWPFLPLISQARLLFLCLFFFRKTTEAIALQCQYANIAFLRQLSKPFLSHTFILHKSSFDGTKLAVSHQAQNMEKITRSKGSPSGTYLKLQARLLLQKLRGGAFALQNDSCPQNSQKQGEAANFHGKQRMETVFQTTKWQRVYWQYSNFPKLEFNIFADIPFPTTFLRHAQLLCRIVACFQAIVTAL